MGAEEWELVELDEHAIRARLGDEIRSLRNELRVSQQELAARAGLDRSYVAGIESGQRNPTIVVMARIAVALNTTVAELARGIPPAVPPRS